VIGRRRREPAPPAGITAAPRGTPGDFAQLLAVYGAVRFVIPRGYWCYLLIGNDGMPLYPGITRNLMRRLGEHLTDYGSRIADVRVIKCRSEHEARVLQFVFADRFDHCVETFLGTEKYEAYRAELERSAKNMDLPAHVTARHSVRTPARAQEAS
jgi:hypothetical protein